MLEQRPILRAKSGDQDSGTHGETFSSHVEALLDRTEYRRSDRGDDREDIFRLRYKAYLANGIVTDSENHMLSDDLDDTPNAHLFGVFVDGRLLSTLRIHHVTADMPWSTSTRAFGDIVLPMLDEGLTFVCMSRFASDPEWTRHYPQLPFVTLRLAGMACLHFNVPYGLSTVREDHAGFYKRIYRSECISGPRPYPGVLSTVVLYRTDAHTDKEAFFSRFPFFRSTPMERRMLFAKPAMGEPEPLTILPTARFAKAA
ncbi:MAG: hypothetical protein M9924_10990 [Rhizobiaceae bacterium]|nr:hypothetical protein [Rhizobiaceae bacterium]